MVWKFLGFVLLTGLSAYVIYQWNSNFQSSPVVEVSSGHIQGSLAKSRLGREFYQFLGVPYAQPPVGILRFAKPLQPYKWKGVLECTRFKPKCVQVDALTRSIMGNEDCLFLNVYVPKKGLHNPSKKLPVIVYIHGGYFMIGGADYMGPLYLLDEDIILVTLNYRLNVFGFLNTMDGSSQGNFGMYDQVLALKWVQENIHQFGGDPKRVVLAGQSAGSAAVHYHLLSKLSEDLFSAAIMLSGTAIKPWSLVADPKGQAEQVAKAVNCSSVTGHKLVKCLRELPATEIAASQLHAMFTPIMDPLEIFAPSIESCENKNDCFLHDHPYKILKEGKFAKKPVIFGFVADDGLLATSRIYFNSTLRQIVEEDWKSLSPKFFVYSEENHELTKKIQEFYIGNSEQIDFMKSMENITNIFTDRLYSHSSVETLKLMSDKTPMYSYYFNYSLERGMTYLYDLDPDLPIVPQLIWKEIKSIFEKCGFLWQRLELGKSHGDDMILLFNIPVISLAEGKRDFNVSRQFVKLWVDFANDPWDELKFNGNTWPRVSSDSIKLMAISNDDNHGKIIPEPFKERMKFWDEAKLPWI